MTQGQGAYIFGCDGLVLLPEEAAFFAEAQPWGFILFGRNIENPGQLRKLCEDLRTAVGWNIPIGIDQEGGRVQRMGPPHWRAFLPALDQVQLSGPANAAKGMALRMRIIAHELRAVGIDMNCAPLGDIARPETHAVLRNRCYGETRNTVVEVASAVAGSLLEGGVLPVLKHIPGHGRAMIDSHLDLPEVTASADILRAEDFAAFKDLANLPLGMTAHLRFPAFDDQPATISRRMIRLIREEIGFSGAIMTDDISMEALSGDVASRSSAAIDAGCDLVLHCNGKLAEMQAVALSAGRQTSEATQRTNAALAMRQNPVPIDIEALSEDLAALLS